jgi:two-component system cell cycle sensor histidine kinase/response regulator CckA
MHHIHDLRLVFVAIAASLDNLRGTKGDDSPEVEHIGRLVQTGMAMTNELLVSRTLDPTSFIVANDIIGDLEGAIVAIAGPDIAVETRLAAKDSRVFAQAVDLERILLNVVFNAVAAMPSGGTLTIDTDLTAGPSPSAPGRPTVADGQFRLRIRDTGHGIPDDRLATLIDPYAKPRHDGTGLGIASVALVLLRIGGTLSIESLPGSGTEVTITVPLSRAFGPWIH